MDNERELAAELQAARNDRDEWDTEPIDIAVVARKSEVVSFRLPSEALDQLEQAASEAGETISEYVRNALHLRITGTAVTTNSVNLMAGLGSFVWIVEPPSVGSSRAEGQEEIPDFPPLTVNV